MFKDELEKPLQERSTMALGKSNILKKKSEFINGNWKIPLKHKGELKAVSRGKYNKILFAATILKCWKNKLI